MDQLLTELEEVRTVIKLRDTDSATKFKMLRSMKLDDINRIAGYYFMMDAYELHTVEKRLYNKFLKHSSLSENQDGVDILIKY